MKAFTLRLALFIISLVVIGELIFRFVIPACDPPFQTQDPESGVFLYDPALRRDGLFTSGQLAQQRSHWHINNAGWDSPVEYLPPSPNRKPVIAIFGDSYIEGLFVDVRESMSCVLRQALGGRYEVYNFGQSAIPFSHQLVLARYAAKHFDPQIFVFFLEEWDLKESYRQYSDLPRALQLVERDGNIVEDPSHYVYHVNPLTRIFKHSALIRYLILNAQLPGLATGDVTANPLNRCTTAEADLAAAYVVEALLRDHPNSRLVFLIDSPRADIYQGRPITSLPVAASMRKACDVTGDKMLDLGPIFRRDYLLRHVPFNYGHDIHWNAEGHRIAALALEDSLVAWGFVSAP